MPVLINKESGYAEHLDDVSAQQAIQSGSHAVPLNDPQGNPVNVDYQQASDLLAKGYTQPAPEQLGSLVEHGQLSSTAGQVKTFARGVASGLVTAPGAAILEHEFLRTPKEDILKSMEANPWSKALGEAVGIGLGAFTGSGEAALLAKAETAVAGRVASKLTEKTITQMAASQAAGGAVGAALFQMGDEAAKAYLQDPNQSFSGAISNIGLAGLIGGAGGGVLGGVSGSWNALAEGKAGQFAADFRARLKQHVDMPNPVEATAEQLKKNYESIKNTAINEVYGAGGLRQQELEKLLPKEMTEQFTKHTDELAQKIAKTVDNMKANLDEFPAHNVKELERQYSNLEQALLKPEAKPVEVYNALNEFKRYAQSTYQAKKRVNTFDVGYKFLDTVEKLGQDVRDNLASKVWGEAGARTAEINKAWAGLQQPLKDFESNFTSKINNVKEIDAGKVNTFLNNVGKYSGEKRQSILGEFMNASDNFSAAMEKTHANLGIDNPLKGRETNILRDILSHKETPGSKAADYLVKKGIHELLGGSVGGAAGLAAGDAVIGAMAGKYLLSPMFEKILPSLVKPILQQEASGAGLKAAIDFSNNAIKGQLKLQTAAKAVFNNGSFQIAKMTPMQQTALKLKVAEADSNPESLLDRNTAMAHYLPDHAMKTTMAAATAISYLKTLKPNEAPLGPLDKPQKPNAVAEARYNAAIEIAHDPTIVLKKIQTGTLTVNDIKDLNGLYPGLHDAFQAELMQHMSEKLAAEKRIPYKTKMSMSLFLGQPLDASMQPQSIISTQPQPTMNQMPQRPPSATSMQGLKKMPENFRTPQESRILHKSSR